MWKDGLNFVRITIYKKEWIATNLSERPALASWSSSFKYIFWPTGWRTTSIACSPVGGGRWWMWYLQVRFRGYMPGKFGDLIRQTLHVGRLQRAQAKRSGRFQCICNMQHAANISQIHGSREMVWLRGVATFWQEGVAEPKAERTNYSSGPSIRTWCKSSSTTAKKKIEKRNNEICIKSLKFTLLNADIFLVV